MLSVLFALVVFLFLIIIAHITVQYRADKKAEQSAGRLYERQAIFEWLNSGVLPWLNHTLPNLQWTMEGSEDGYRIVLKHIAQEDEKGEPMWIGIPGPVYYTK
jgi:hypothetical protein